MALPGGHSLASENEGRTTSLSGSYRKGTLSTYNTSAFTSRLQDVFYVSDARLGKRMRWQIAWTRYLVKGLFFIGKTHALSLKVYFYLPCIELFTSTADIVIYLRILLYYHHNFLKERLRESSKSGIREGIGSGTPRGSFTSVWKRRQNDESQWIVPQRHSQHLQHISLYKSSARCFLCFRCQIGKTHALTDSMDTLSR